MMKRPRVQPDLFTPLAVHKFSGYELSVFGIDTVFICEVCENDSRCKYRVVNYIADVPYRYTCADHVDRLPPVVQLYINLRGL
jgi:hypothetical protein